MAVVRKSMLVGYSASQMFQLVDRVEDYPDFMPWCGGTKVERRPDGTTHATIDIDFHHVRQSFATENTRTVPEQITMTLSHGPFRHLDGNWRFIELAPEACKIEFSLSYEFSNRLVDKVISPVFNHIAGTFVEAFVRRAEQVYGVS